MGLRFEDGGPWDPPFRRLSDRNGVLVNRCSTTHRPEIDVELDEFHGSVGCQLTDHCQGVNERSRCKKYPVVVRTVDERREVIELGREPLDDGKELYDLEVVGRRFAVPTSLRWELPIEVLEERQCGSNSKATDAQRPLGASSLAMRCSIRSRTRARNAGST